jgi:hypothetical protein
MLPIAAALPNLGARLRLRFSGIHDDRHILGGWIKESQLFDPPHCTRSNSGYNSSFFPFVDPGILVHSRSG